MRIARWHILSPGSLRDASEDGFIQPRLRQLDVHPADEQRPASRAQAFGSAADIGGDGVDAGLIEPDCSRVSAAGWIGERCGHSSFLPTWLGDVQSDDGVADGPKFLVAYEDPDAFGRAWKRH